MRSVLLGLAAAAAVLLPACSREEEPVANRFERQKAAIENKASALEAQVENEVGADREPAARKRPMPCCSIRLAAMKPRATTPRRPATAAPAVGRRRNKIRH